MTQKVDSMEPRKNVTSEQQKIFIIRERIRRRLIKTRPHETICLDGEEVGIILKWIKELEERRY